MPMKDDIQRASIPGGAGGVFNLPSPSTHVVMKRNYSPHPGRHLDGSFG